MAYIDGFVIPVPKKNLAAYKRMAVKAAKVWKDHGALEIRECAAEDMKFPYGVAFPKLAKLKPGETVVFSWITFKSRAHRDKVNAAVMKDPRLKAMMDPKQNPFDMKRMTYGGFDVIVAA
ncbi:MAG: DUF1428 domain-containing protein [Hyphomicrobium sp.]